MNSPATNNALPVTDPAAENESPRSRSCKHRILVTHSMKEAGGLRWAPWRLFLLTRLISFGATLGLAVYHVITQPYFHMSLIHNFGLALSFLFLVICTALEARGSNNKIFATATLHLHGIFAVTSLYVLTVGLAVLIFGYGATAVGLYYPYCIPFVLYLVDVLMMQSRMRLRFRCAVIAWLIDLIASLVYISTLGIGFKRGWIFFGAALISLVISLLVIAITRIPWCCFKNDADREAS